MRCENCGSAKVYVDDEPCVEDIGRVADSIDNMRAGMDIPSMPAHITIAAAKEALPDWISRLRRAYTRLSGDSPWDDDSTGRAERREG